MKFYFLLFTIFCSSFIAAQSINQYGHIQYESIDYTIEEIDNQPYVSTDEYLLKGNSFFDFDEYLVTLQNTCGNTAVTLRLYNTQSQLVFEDVYTQVIDLQGNSTADYLYFMSEGKWIILNTSTFNTRHIDVNTPIAVNETGEIVYYKDQQVHYQGQAFAITQTPRSIQISSGGEVYVFGRDQYWLISNSTCSIQNYERGYFFEANRVGADVFVVEKKVTTTDFIFSLSQVTPTQTILLEQKEYPFLNERKKIYQYTDQTSRNTTSGIMCPFYPEEESYPVRIGNSYGEHQHYGGSPYLHPGVDLLGDIGQDVYAVTDGVIKAVLTIGGDAYWRIAIGDNDTDDEQGGYLYAHVAQNSIPFTVGDEVMAGDYLGEIVEWFGYDFHHLHFARIKDQGDIWTGGWWTEGNVLVDMLNFEDNTAPVFQPLWLDQTIAFRAKEAPYDILSPDCLAGEFDIVCNAYDYSNTDWKLDIHELRIELWEDLADGAPIYNETAFDYHFLLDAYAASTVTSQILETIYATDLPWLSIGNYNERRFYQQVSKSNHDGIINEDDEGVYFDSTEFPDGEYTIRIYAQDAKGNESYTDQVVRFCNSPTSTSILTAQTYQLNPYPNPSTGTVSIDWPEGSQNCQVYDILGRQIEVQTTIKNGQLLFTIPQQGIYTVSMLSADGVINSAIITIK